MMKTMISQYIRTLFNESRDSELTAGDLDDRFDYLVEWDEETAEALAQECGTLVGHLTELSHQCETLRSETQHLTKKQMEVWNTYLRPFPKHNLDMDALRTIWEKFDTDASVTEEEYALADQYVLWFEENALSRLPVKRCDPIPLINRARRYSRLVRLNAPAVVRENEARRFAEEFVLYHCMKQ